MSLRKKGPKIMGDFEFSDLKLHQQQEIVNAVRKGATRRDIMTWMMAAGATATTGGAILGAPHRFWQVHLREVVDLSVQEISMVLQIHLIQFYVLLQLITGEDVCFTAT